MRINKKIILGVVAVLLLGTTPAFADLEGVWAGEGEGYCYAPDGSIIYPWQTWMGEVSEGTFEGDWEDSDDNYGGFTGGIIFFYVSVEPGSHTMAHCEGEWTWIGPDSAEPVEMGSFEMEFDLDDETCDGSWSTPEGATPGYMWGERIED